ncbi:F-box only protein 33 [Syngnathus scovelli]|uniref:F-box only protein 33 n=1 Tax=Syngnathus scovelli TaxID=161590 RepID=UPI00210F69A8|nr:F-box only protein 33 [Syngnathus scovelli]
MALCGGVGAMALPSELIVHIFSFLSDRDKLRASAVCSRWRECLFYPALWSELKLRIGGGNGASSEEYSRLEFLMRRFGAFVRELQLELAPGEVGSRSLNNEPPSTRVDLSPGPDNDPQPSERWGDAMATYVDQALCVLSNIRNNRNLQKLRLYGDTCALQQEGLLNNSNLHQIHHKKINEIQRLFKELLSHSRQLRWLSCSFMLGVVTPSSLACLSNPSSETLQHLSLLDHQLGAALISPPELERLSSLHSLALDFSDLTSELCSLLASPQRTPLHRLSLLLNGTTLEVKSLDGTATDDDWKALVRVSANLRVYVMAVEVSSSELLRALKPSLPLERIHLDSYSTLVTDATLELIAQQYNKTLTHFLLLRDDPEFPDLSVNRNEDPLVLLAWRCTQLAVLVIHGYTVWSHNLVAISRLRGSSLRVLTVSEESIDFDPDQLVFLEGDPVHNLVKEVSLGLGRVWHPCLDYSLVLTEPSQHFHRELHAFSMGM